MSPTGAVLFAEAPPNRKKNKESQMSKKFFGIMALSSLLLLPVVAQGDIVKLHQNTTTPADSRFEIVQSQLAARWTFKLDRYTGEVMQLVLNPDKENTWGKVLVQDLPKIKNANKPRFMIFTSGIAAKHTFLLDVATGKTWTIISDSIPTKDGETDVFLFKPFK
jgi:hypothetical protein